jgi:hypothetical protein
MNYGLRGKELLLDLQRSDFLPPWDEEGVRTIANEISDAYSKMVTVYDEEGTINNAFYGLCLLRNRRYILR